jgi:hypothetical protein
MVETVIDPIRMPTVTLLQTEMDEIEDLMAQGQLPPDWLERYHVAVAANVFGADHKKDKHGNPIEQGRGAAANMTSQSVEAYKKWGKDEPGYAENLKRMEAQLAACNEVRAAGGDARRERARKMAGVRR